MYLPGSTHATDLAHVEAGDRGRSSEGTETQTASYGKMLRRSSPDHCLEVMALPAGTQACVPNLPVYPKAAARL